MTQMSMITAKQENTFFNNFIYLLPLILVLVATAVLVVPTISYNINDPNLIVYTSQDEGSRMDLIWSHYSGKKRETFQSDYEYGLVMLYLADFARSFLSKFIDFTPGTFVLLLRWLHLIFWMASILALWRLVKYHFGNYWQPILVIMILSTRIGFPYFMVGLKPDSIVLFFMIIGLDYTLRIINNPSMRNLFIAIACSSLALIVKFSGIFLLPAIVLAMGLAERYKKNKKCIFPRIKTAWILYLFIGLALILLALSPILFYVRKTTGSTWYEQFGLWGSLAQNKLVLFLILAGIFFILLFIIIWFLNKRHKLEKIIRIINEISSHGFIVFGLFLGFTLFFGFRWIIKPQFFLNTYSQLAPYAFNTAMKSVSEKGLLFTFFHNIFYTIIHEFRPIIIILFIVYIIMEIVLIRKNIKYDSLKLLKRLVLVGFILPFLIFIFLTMTRVMQSHMLPFIAAMAILISQGINMFYNTFDAKKWVKKGCLTIVFILIITDISLSARAVISVITNKYHQHECIVFDVAKWWQKNIPVDTCIVADHYTRVYIPPGYNNIKTVPWKPAGRALHMRQLVDAYHPQFIYFDEMECTGKPLPPIEQILPDKKVKLVKSFDSTTKRYQRRRSIGMRFVIYKVIY